MNLQRTGCLLLVAIVVSWLSTAVVHGQAQTQTPSPQPAPSVPLPERNPLRISPVLPKEVAPPHPREIETAEWSAQEVQVARDQCSMMLDGTDVVYRDLEPIREGVCGTPGPIELSSIGSTPVVKISPPARVTCGMAASLNAWSDTVLQPAARNYLGNEITEIRNVAAYVCRNRYNAPNQRISEHALANALDMAAFKTNAGEWVTVLDHWYIYLERSLETNEVMTAEAPSSPQPPDSKERLEPVAPISPSADDASSELEPSEDVREPTPQASFLKELHSGGCKLFGTVLGPEANDAHKDHFHFDLAARNYSNFCE